MSYNVPILFLVFNRPLTTAIVFDKIKSIKPTQLYIASDGPRTGNNDDIENCKNVRDIISNIDWHCEVKTLLRDTNLGCRKSVSQSITWFFKNVEYGIILEDDCLPNDSFFLYCEELLLKYKNDERIMHISGCNLECWNLSDSPSYIFSKSTMIWGWASWARAWKYYDVNMSDYELFANCDSLKYFELSASQKKEIQNSFSDMYLNKRDTWDTQWQYAIIKNYGLNIFPKKNLIVNIGFGANATHTIFSDTKFSHLICHEMSFPLTHPAFFIPECDFDNIFWKYYIKEVQRLNSISFRLKKKFNFFRITNLCNLIMHYIILITQTK